MNALREECQQLRDKLIALRREFHRAPELGLHEYHTAARIERELDRCGIPHERVGETAVAGHLTGSGNGSGLVVLLADPAKGYGVSIDDMLAASAAQDKAA